MATISGTLKFDRDRTANSAGLSGIANVPIVLQNTQTNAMLAVLTDANGNYSFTNVPDGDYRIVEAYGTPASASPGDFSGAAAGSAAVSQFPPLSYAPNPPAGATNLDAVTPTTIPVTVAGADLVGQDILNGPVTYTPIADIMDDSVIVLPQNLITQADNGTFGSFPQGTPANTGADPNPYPDLGTQFTYTLPNPAGVTPAFHQYTLQNIMNDATANEQSTWWRIADHTTGNETGRAMVINGDAPGASIFEQQVTVKPNTYYLFSSWILNLSKNAGLVDPQLGVEVLDANGQALYSATLGTLIPMNPNNPEWKEIGTAINSQNNTALTVRFVSMGPEAFGNDYAIDDIALKEVQILAYTPQKSADISEVNVGGIVKYTVTLANTGENPLTDVTLKDLVPDGFTFIPGSVIINGIHDPEADPNAGFAVSDVPGKSTLVVNFGATATAIPDVNPAINRALVDYAYSPVAGGIPAGFERTTNDVPITVIPAEADLAITKTADQNPVKAGTLLTYTLTVTNHGPSDAANINVTDQVSGAEYSGDNGNTWQPWNGSYSLAALAGGSSVTLLIRGTIDPAANGTISNTAAVSSTTADPNPANNSSMITIPVITASSDLSLVKTASPMTVVPCGTVTYTLVVSNLGPDEALDVRLSDELPPQLRCVGYSLDNGGTWYEGGAALKLGNLAAGAQLTVLLKGIACACDTTSFVNSARVTAATPDPNQNNNFSEVAVNIEGRMLP